MRIAKAFALLAVAAPAWGQYTGPAVLTRGEAPAALSAPQIAFRPYAEVSGIYDTGLAGAVISSNGTLANSSSFGVEVAFGVSGSHEWKRTHLGLDYRGSLTHYASKSYYDGFNQSLLLSLKQTLTRHAVFTLRQSAGMFSRDFGLLGLQQTVAFDPTTSHIPTTDFFDNRTLYTNTQADLVLQKSARLSFAFGGDAALTFRRSSALTDSRIYVARGDTAYRLTRRTTIGGLYNFYHMTYSTLGGGTDAHGAAFAYAVRLSRTVEFAGYAGVYRVESKFLQKRPLDPVIAQLLGVSESVQIVHAVGYVPNVNLRISKAIHNGVLFAGAARGITAGNGLFATTRMTTVIGGYAFTGLRRWSINMQAEYSRGNAMDTLGGVYGTAGGGITIARSLGRMAHVVASYRARQYQSPNYSNYNRFVNEARIGIGFTPGDVPLRIW